VTGNINQQHTFVRLTRPNQSIRQPIGLWRLHRGTILWEPTVR